MARPYKVGNNYFPSDVNIYSDLKIMDLLNEYGPIGYLVYDWIIRKVYQEGYYLEADLDQLSSFFVRDIGSKWIRNKSVVTQVIYFCADIGLFDHDLLAQGIITSVGIQRRYLEITSRRKQPNKLEKYRILPDAFSSADINSEIDNNNLVFDNDNSIMDSNNSIERKENKNTIMLPLKDGSEYAVCTDQIEEWQGVFKQLDVQNEVQRMRAWCLANPSKRKTRRGIQRFATNWLLGNTEKKEKKGGGVNAYPDL